MQTSSPYYFDFFLNVFKLIKVTKFALRLSTGRVRTAHSGLFIEEMEARVEIENCNANGDSQMQSRLEKVIFAVQGFAVAPARNSRRQSSRINWSLA